MAVGKKRSPGRDGSWIMWVNDDAALERRRQIMEMGMAAVRVFDVLVSGMSRDRGRCFLGSQADIGQRAGFSRQWTSKILARFVESGMIASKAEGGNGGELTYMIDPALARHGGGSPKRYLFHECRIENEKERQRRLGAPSEPRAAGRPISATPVASSTERSRKKRAKDRAAKRAAEAAAQEAAAIKEAKPKLMLVEDMTEEQKEQAL